MEAGTGNASSTARTAKVLRLPGRAARGAPGGLALLRAAYEAAGGSCARPVEMRPLARRLGLEPRAVEHLAMRLQAQRLVRVVSMAKGLLRLTPEGARAAERADERAAEGAESDPPGPVAPTGAPRAGGGLAGRRVAPVLGRGAARELQGMLGPLKAGLDLLDLDGALDEEQRSELAAEVRTIEAQLGSPRPKRRIVAVALESVGGVVRSAAGAGGAAGGAESEGILRAIDAFLGGAGGAAGEARAGRAARGTPRGARDGPGPARPGDDPADGDGPGARRPEEEGGDPAADVRARGAGGARVRKRVRRRARRRVRHDGGRATERATERAQDAGRPASEGADGAAGEAGGGAGGGAARAARGAGAGRRVLRVVGASGDVLRTTFDEHGEILDEEVVGNAADPPSEVGRGGEQAARRAGEEAGRATGGVGQGADRAAEGAKRMTRDVGGAPVGRDAKGGGDDEAREADAREADAREADGAVRRATGPAGAATEGARDAADRAAGTAGGAAPSPRMPGGRTPAGERRTARRGADGPGRTVVRAILDGSGDVLDEWVVGRR